MPSEDQVMPCDDDAPYCEPEVKMAIPSKRLQLGFWKMKKPIVLSQQLVPLLFVMGYCKEPAFVLQLLLKWWIGQIT